MLYIRFTIQYLFLNLLRIFIFKFQILFFLVAIINFSFPLVVNNYLLNYFFRVNFILFIRFVT